MPIQYWKRNDLSGSVGEGDFSPRGLALTYPRMRATGAEILYCVASQHASQLFVTEDDDVVGAFASNSS